MISNIILAILPKLKWVTYDSLFKTLTVFGNMFILFFFLISFLHFSVIQVKYSYFKLLGGWFFRNSLIRQFQLHRELINMEYWNYPHQAATQLGDSFPDTCNVTDSWLIEFMWWIRELNTVTLAEIPLCKEGEIYDGYVGRQ